MEITPNKLEQMLITAAELGARQVIDKLGLDEKQIQLAKAYRVYGRRRVDLWMKEGDVDYVKQGHRIYLSKVQLEKQASINRLIERCFGDE